MNVDPLERIRAGSGGRLAPLAFEWGKRPEVPPTISITHRDLDVLSCLHDVGWLTSSMLQLLFWGRAAPRGPAVQCCARMKLLHDAGLADRLRPRTIRERGSHEWIYRLSTEGWLLLRRARRTADTDDYTPAEVTNIAYIEHDVDVAALVVSLAARAAGTLGPLAPLPATVGFDWLGPRRGFVDPRVQLPVEQRHAGSRLGERCPHYGRSIPGYLKPDATLYGRATVNGDPLAVMIEYDRTRRASKQLKRMQRYDRFLLEGWRRSRYATSPEEPILLLVCDAEAQLDSFVRAADTELIAHHTNLEGREPYFPGRGQVGFTTFDRLMDGDWRMLQVPEYPPGHSRRLYSEPVELQVALDRLYARPQYAAVAA